MVLEQVDLVDVEKAAVGLREQARLEALFAVGERALEVQRADHAVFGRPERQVDDGRRASARSSAPSCALRPCAPCAPALVPFGLVTSPGRRGRGRGRRRLAIVGAALDRLDLGQQRGERPDRGRFSRSPVAEREDAADARIDGRDQEGGLHVLLADDCGKRIRLSHIRPTACGASVAAPCFEGARRRSRRAPKHSVDRRRYEPGPQGRVNGLVINAPRVLIARRSERPRLRVEVRRVRSLRTARAERTEMRRFASIAIGGLVVAAAAAVFAVSASSAEEPPHTVVAERRRFRDPRLPVPDDRRGDGSRGPKHRGLCRVPQACGVHLRRQRREAEDRDDGAGHRGSRRAENGQSGRAAEAAKRGRSGSSCRAARRSPKCRSPTIRPSGCVEAPATRYAVLRFSGVAEDGSTEAKTAELEAILKARGLAAAGPPLIAQYNPPWMPGFMRRNEIMIPIR